MGEMADARSSGGDSLSRRAVARITDRVMEDQRGRNSRSAPRPHAGRSIWAPSSGALPEGGHDGFRGGASGIQRAPRISPWRVGSGATVRGRERRESACCSPGGQRGPQRFVGSSRRNRARSLSKGIDARPLSFRRSVSARGWADQAAVRGSRTAPPRRSRPPDR
jgi:hypothetical protein